MKLHMKALELIGGIVSSHPKTSDERSRSGLEIKQTAQLAKFLLHVKTRAPWRDFL